MSTDYMLRRPLKPSTIQRRTGWWVIENDNGTMLTDGHNYVHHESDSKGRVVGFTRFGGNQPHTLVEGLGAVSEHDDEDPDFDTLFPRDLPDDSEFGHDGVVP